MDFTFQIIFQTCIFNSLAIWQDFDTYRVRSKNSAEVQSRPTPRTGEIFRRRIFLRKCIEIMKILNYVELICYSLNQLFVYSYSVLNCQCAYWKFNSTFKLYFIFSNNLVKYGTIRNMDPTSNFLHSSTVMSSTRYTFAINSSLHLFISNDKVFIKWNNCEIIVR